MVQIELDLAETIVAEAGDMTYMVENEFISVRLQKGHSSVD